MYGRDGVKAYKAVVRQDGISLTVPRYSYYRIAQTGLNSYGRDVYYIGCSIRSGGMKGYDRQSFQRFPILGLLD